MDGEGWLRLSTGVDESLEIFSLRCYPHVVTRRGEALTANQNQRYSRAPPTNKYEGRFASEWTTVPCQKSMLPNCRVPALLAVLLVDMQPLCSLLCSSNKYPACREKDRPINHCLLGKRSWPKCEMNMKINDTWIQYLGGIFQHYI